MNINLHIDRLVLDGINIRSDQRNRLKASIEAELGRLLMEGGISPGLAKGGALPAISAKGFQLGSGKGSISNPVQLGRQIAQSVYGEIGK